MFLQAVSSVSVVGLASEKVGDYCIFKINLNVVDSGFHVSVTTVVWWFGQRPQLHLRWSKHSGKDSFTPTRVKSVEKNV